MADLNRLATTITCHAWSPDGSRVAICPNDNTIQIYQKSGTSFKLEHTLNDHDKVVTGIDWGKKTNRIVSCSQDRNAYVWTFDQGKWKPVLVILRINRCATHVQWSPQENKFAVATGAKVVAVCYFEEDNDWWVSKHVKRHESTITDLDWHPGNALCATASTDYKIRVFHSAIKGVDKKKPEATCFGPPKNFGEIALELDIGGWGQSVKWNPSGNALAWCAQDSTIGICDMSSGQPVVSTITWNKLPFVSLAWTSDTNIVAGGHDCNPTLFSNQGGWKFVKQLDAGTGGQAAVSKGPSAMNVFKNKVDKGTDAVETSLNTKHQNAITLIQKPNASEFSTSGVDGRILLWKNP
eukprot:TRINITY_DN12474_c0_g1_i1.p2 TRINITY_DN12474_c0_g1~~TRINITY_DN12474_c0_g1_i1.p2  ORF type:complete len:352 (+),score=49.63 TRINITY_DN12474_c0_g1_i1:45-1100(+)